MPCIFLTIKNNQAIDADINPYPILLLLVLYTIKIPEKLNKWMD